MSCGGGHKNWSAGDELDGFEVAVTQDLVNRYAAVSGDYNPIHVDAEFAAKTQFGGRIAHGMLGAALIHTAVMRNFGVAALNGAKFKFKFKAPVMPGDALIVGGKVRSAADGALALDADCRKTDGTVAIACAVNINTQTN